MEKKNLKFAASYSSISKYVDELYDGFIPSVVGKVRTLDYVTIVPDVKYSKVIPTVSTTFNFADASACSTFADGATSSVTGVTLTTGYLKFEEAFCLNEMEQYYFGQYMKKGSDQDTIPFEAAFVDEKMGKIAKKLDTIFWLGNSSPAVTGIIAGATAGGAVGLTGQSFTVSTAITNGIIATFDNMMTNVNSDILSEDLTIFVGQDVFNKYIQSVRNLNLYHYNSNDAQLGEFGLLGYNNVKVVATVGLNGQSKALLGKADWLFWGTDFAPEDEPIKGEYNMYLDKYLMRYKVKIGTAVAFPSYFVYAS